MLTAVTAVVPLGSVRSAATPHAAGQPTLAAPRTASVPTPQQLASLEAQVEAATARAQRESDAVLAAAGQSIGLRLALDRLAAQRDTVQREFDSQAAVLYEAEQAGSGIPSVSDLFGAPDMQLLVRAQRNQLAGVSDAVGRVTDAAAQLASLSAQADHLRAGLVARAQTALAAQDQARALLARATAAYAAAQARADAAARAAAAAAAARLASAQARLDTLSGQLAIAVSPVDSARGRAALAHQGPVLAALEAAGGGYPAGYRSTGQYITGTSSWYGPGFVGRPTASGAPYDPEQLTCAMLAVPLGTVVHVTNLGTGLSVNVLVSDRGPYVGNRVIDLSHAAAVAVGNTGLATVRIEILAPTG